MITMEPLFPPLSGQASDPILLGVTRGLAQVLEPLAPEDLPDHLADLVRRLDEGEREG
jgi:hypothetical protein